MTRLLAFLAIAAVTAVPALSAQGGAGDSLSCYFDTSGFQHTRTVAIGLAPGWRYSKLRAEKPVPAFYQLVEQVIRQYYQPPQTISLPFWARTAMTRTADSLDTVGHGLDGMISFRLDETGQLADSLIQVTTDSPELNASIIAAIRRADSAAGFPPPDGDVQRENGRILLRTVDFENPRGPAVGLVRASVPIVDLDRPARFRNPPKIRYPDDGRWNGLDDNITIEFVVNEQGRVNPSSVRILQGEYREFAQAALEALEATKFTPAQVAGCPVPQLFEMQYRFRIERN